MEHSIEFFAIIADAFPAGHGLTAADYYDRIDSRLMRRYLIASRYVESTFALNDSALRAEAIEARRIEYDVEDLTGGRRAILDAYRAELNRRPLSLRTRRLYLSAAHKLLLQKDDGSPPDRDQVMQFLRTRPGMAASLTAFIAYCREARGIDLRMPACKTFARTANDRVSAQVAALKQALSEIAKYPLADAPDELVAKVLATALGVSLRRLDEHRSSVVFGADGSITVMPDARITSGDPLNPIVRRWCAH